MGPLTHGRAGCLSWGQLLMLISVVADRHSAAGPRQCMLTCHLRSSVGASSPHSSAQLEGQFAIRSRRREMAQHPLIINGLNGMINAEEPGSSWESVWKAGLHPGEV